MTNIKIIYLIAIFIIIFALATQLNIFSDDFNSPALNTSLWTPVDPRGDAVFTTVGTGTSDELISITVPAGTSHDVWDTGNFAPRVMQSVSDIDFEVEVKFQSRLSQKYQMQGIIIEDNSRNFLRFDFFSDGSNIRIFAASFTPKNNELLENQGMWNKIIGSSPSAIPLYMRVKREGNLWTQSYSFDGAKWTVAATFTHALKVTSVGPFVGNHGSSESTSPAFTGLIAFNKNVNHRNVTIEWTHLSSNSGDLPSPGTSTVQTASLILDIDRDGLNDFIIGNQRGQALVWFKKNPTGWTKYLIENDTFSIEAGGAFHDIDGDGDLDIVFGGLSSNEVWWWENPYPRYDRNVSWERREIKNSGAEMHHDQIFGDFSGDGKTELVFWNQKAKKLFIADIPSNPKNVQPWPYQEIYSYSGVSHAEGLAIGDIDGDGNIEIIGGGRWFKYNGGTNYSSYLIDDEQRSSRIAVGDLKTGGLPEIVMVPGDGIGRLKWYECENDPKNSNCWVGHDLLGFDVDHGHSLDIADINGDGKLDIFVAEMRLNGGNSDAKMWIFWGDGNGNFREEVVATGYANHESRIGDLDGDDDLDIMGKPLNWDTPGLNIWLNDAADSSQELWDRQIIDLGKPWTSVFITSADLDNDGNKDIITGGWWYRNPGNQGINWTRHTIGEPLNNMAAVHDFDNDGNIDILGTQGKGLNPDSVFVWARNDGSGNFTILNNIEPGDGDFLQGAAVASFQGRGPKEVALSWHATGKGIQMLTVPVAPSNDTWSWRRISDISFDEEISSGDIDRDGDIDLLLGTAWLSNEGTSWRLYTFNSTSGMPDRNTLADINGDGRLDAVVGFEAISEIGKLALYEQSSQATSMWTEHVIANVIGPMSLDVADMDNDGDLDVVAGEHNLERPHDAKLYLFENLDGLGNAWKAHVIYTGDEHHNGAQTVDIDGDGDLDIISIGLSHESVLLYENKAIK